jgi:hypothetical protein
VKEPQIKQKAISHAQKFLTEKTPTGGIKNTELTASKVREIIKAADLEVRKEYLKDHPEQTPSAEIVSKIAHVPEETVVPVEEKKSSFVPADQIDKNPGLVNQDAPDLRTKDVTVVVTTPPNVSNIEPVYPDEERWVLKRGLQTGVADRIKEGYAKSRLDAYDKAVEFWVNNIRMFSEEV